MLRHAHHRLDALDHARLVAILRARALCYCISGNFTIMTVESHVRNFIAVFRLIRLCQPTHCELALRFRLELLDVLADLRRDFGVTRCAALLLVGHVGHLHARVDLRPVLRHDALDRALAH